ncbi:DUF397 domain-containing protein [Streptomyces sp. NBC_00443]
MPSSSVPWRRSSYSNGMGGECLEVATSPRTIAVRDSKAPTGPQLSLSPATWENFIGAISRTSKHRPN